MLRRHNHYCNYKYILRTIYRSTNLSSNRLREGSENDSTDMPLKPTFCLAALLRHMRSAKFFFLVTCLSFTLSLIWIQLGSRSEDLVTKSLTRKKIGNDHQNQSYCDDYNSSLPKNLKYLLLWNPKGFAPFYIFGSGQTEFLNHKCSSVNCYVTANRKFFKDNITRFDAIAFNGPYTKPQDLPYPRSAHQKYIYVTMESNDNYPVCLDTFDGFFNWTATYRMDSDIPYPYVNIYDLHGRVMGPKPKMKWVDNMKEVDGKVIDRLLNKSRAAAWFVSNCMARNERMDFVWKLQAALAKYSYTIDVYGKCGNLRCPRKKQKEICGVLLRRDYYFYMSLENSFAEDYVTEKLLTALKHDVVPIVYGGADYSRFLPPGSYINVRNYKPEELAALMNKLIHSPKTYIDYFKWKSHYKYSGIPRIVCAVCAALNNETMFKNVSVYQRFREWWYPDYKTDKRC